MASYDVFIKPSALKELESIGSRKLRRKLAEHIQSLADNPRPPGCKKLTGADQYRSRRGAYRVVYSIEDERRLVVVVKVGHRKDVYRWPAASDGGSAGNTSEPLAVGLSGTVTVLGTLSV